MSTTDKDFKVKNGLNVGGEATFNDNLILGETPLRFDTITNKLQIQLSGNWVPIAFTSDIPDATQTIGFMDIGLSIDYDGTPTYIVQGNGVTPSGTSKFADGGTPTTNSWEMIFDPGALV